MTLGPFADDFLGVYGANDDAQAAKASAAAVRDMRINWPNLQWARAQARTGQSKLFYYYFQRSPPAPPDMTSTMSKISAKTWEPIMAPNSPTCSAISSRMNGRGPRKIATLPAPCPVIG